MRRIALAISIAAVAAAPVAAHAQTSASSWRRGGTCYEVFIRSFADSNGDGIGDINGLISKLDYINDGNPASQRDLGASCIWLMPVAQSPSYHGYDVSDYYTVESDYGTNDDFKRLIAEAHRRGIRVLVDMVLNHASSEHPYFQEALRDPNSPHRNWFRFSPTVVGKGPWGAEAWHKNPHRDEYYYGVFWQGMPDLNYDTPEVLEEAKRVATFWLREMGVDGFRLDAVPYLVEEGTVLAATPGTHRVLREYGAHVRAINPNSYTVGEVWDSVGAMLPYYPDQLDSYFAFELADALINAVNRGSASRMFDGYMRLQRTMPQDRWSPFLRNHDQTRTLTDLGGDRAKARVAVTLLLTLPGLPFLYYGEEIGMVGNKRNGDEDLRTPMQWTRVGGFTTGTPWRAPQGDWATVNVESQETDPASLLNLHRRLVHLRAANRAIASGELAPLAAMSPQVAAYIRKDASRPVLVIANLGATPVSGVALSALDGTLRPGRYSARGLLEPAGAARLHVTSTGRFTGYVPVPTLAPHQVHVLQLVKE